MNKVTLQKQILSKNQYEKVIDTSFTQLVPQVPLQDIVILPTIDQFFQNYNSLFFQIPKLGATNSHEYLIKTSGNYVGDTQNNEIIEALIEEVTQLRQENLDLQQQIYSIQNTTS